MDIKQIIFSNKLTTYSLGLFFLGVSTFARSFMGIYIFKNFRLGEIVMAVSFLFFIICNIYLLIRKKDRLTIGNNFFIINFIIFISFFYISYISDSQLFITYTYKASSYIWTIGFFYLGYFYFKYNNLSVRYINLQLGVLVFIYFFSIIGLPKSVTNFFLSISDKFEPHKGSDLMILFVTILYLSNRIRKNSRLSFEIFILFSSAFLPLMLFKSRASFISLVLFLFIELLNYKKDTLLNLRRNIFLLFFSILIFIFSIFLVSGSDFLIENQENFTAEIQYGIEYITSYRADPDDEVFRLFYIADDVLGTKTTRIFSTDNNLNWRLQIWQDVYYDLLNKNKIFFGYGYNDIIPAMQRIDRQGLDRLNENVHNYAVNLLARGGLLNLMIFSLLYFFLINKIKLKYGYLVTISYFIPVIFNAFFDVAMENSHFPLIFYFIIGMLYNENEFN